MLGPIVALLLLTSPAAGPVDQLCASWDSASEARCQRQQAQQQQQQLDDLQQQLDRMRQRERDRQNDYNTPGVSLPSSTGSGCRTLSSLNC